MLPGLGFQEVVLLAVIALIVVGPKDLPLMLRKLGRWTARLRGMAQEFRTGFDELARQAELDELKREVDALRRSKPFDDINRELSATAAAVQAPNIPAPPLGDAPKPTSPAESDPSDPLDAPHAPPTPAPAPAARIAEAG